MFRELSITLTFESEIDSAIAILAVLSEGELSILRRSLDISGKGLFMTCCNFTMH